MHKYQSIQLKMPEEIVESVKAFQTTIPDSFLNIKGGGLEDRAHVTVLYGLEDRSVADVKKIFEDFGSITVWFGKVKAFLAADTGEPADVLYVEVVGREVDMLHLLVSAYLPSVSTNPFFKPHMTLAYLNPGEAAKMTGNIQFENKKAIVESIEFADVNENFKVVKLSEEMQIDSRTYARVPEGVRPLSGSIAAAFGYKIRGGKGWVPKKRLEGLLKLAKELRAEFKDDD